MSEFINTIKDKARQDLKRIILPESEDVRVLKACQTIVNEGFAKPVLIGNQDEIYDLARANDIYLDKVEIIDPKNSDKTEKYINEFYEMRKEKGMTEEEAKQTILEQNIYFGTMMVKDGEADGLVSGACHSTSNTLRPALQILKTKPGTKLVSAFFFMVVPNCDLGDNGKFIFADSGLNPEPNDDELSEIAISSAESFKLLTGDEPKVAFLSYSTKGSAPSKPAIEKMVNAYNMFKEKKPEIKADGELQLDAAIIKEVAESKAPDSEIAGEANTLIFPDLGAGNIGYKLVQRLAKAEAYGPLCQGIAKPVNDLSRGCSSDDIVGVVAITAVQAQNQ